MSKFDKFADRAVALCASEKAFAGSVIATSLWLLSGPLFKFSDTWQLIANTGTTLVTFHLGFLILYKDKKNRQEDQTREKALHAKLDQLIHVSQASNDLIRSEELAEEEIEKLRPNKC